MDLDKFNQMYDSIRHNIKEGYKDGGSIRTKYAAGSPPVDTAPPTGIQSLSVLNYTPGLYHAPVVGAQGFVPATSNTTSTTPPATSVSNSINIPYFLNPSFQNSPFDQLAFIGSGQGDSLNTLASALGGPKPQAQPQQLQQPKQPQGQPQVQAPTWFGAKGGHVSQGEPVQTHLTTTIPPVKGPMSQGVESLFKKRYN